CPTVAPGFARSPSRVRRWPNPNEDATARSATAIRADLAGDLAQPGTGAAVLRHVADHARVPYPRRDEELPAGADARYPPAPASSRSRVPRSGHRSRPGR